MGKIFLIGPMGSGKSHWGERIAAALNLPFYDLDNMIQQSQDKTITEIFDEMGENHFRILETQCLSEVAAMDDAVIALGGGTPCYNDNLTLLQHMGTSYYLQSDVLTLVNRLVNEMDDRPLLKGTSVTELATFLEKQLDEREAFYLQADVVVNADELTEDKLKEVFGNSVQ